LQCFEQQWLHSTALWPQPMHQPTVGGMITQTNSIAQKKHCIHCTTAGGGDTPLPGGGGPGPGTLPPGLQFGFVSPGWHDGGPSLPSSPSSRSSCSMSEEPADHLLFPGADGEGPEVSCGRMASLALFPLPSGQTLGPTTGSVAPGVVGGKVERSGCAVT
jgi:hypothetical protein